MGPEELDIPDEVAGEEDVIYTRLANHRTPTHFLTLARVNDAQKDG